MAKLTLLVGPPGSGKSTYGKTMDAVYINQDSQGKDGHITSFLNAVKEQKDIVVDRMNFNKEQRKRYLEVAVGYETSIIVFHENYKECLTRCRARFGNHETINDEQSVRSALQTFFTKYERPTQDEVQKIEFRYPEGPKHQAVIVDLDGTLCNIDHRLHYVQGLKKDWKNFFKLLPEFENVYGSNRVDISNASGYKGYYGEDVYGKVFQELDVFSKVKPNETVFGEIVGPGIQKGYDYGLRTHKFVLFDVKVLNVDWTQSWLKPDEVEIYAMERGFQYVPLLYRGPFNKELAYTLTKGVSKYNDGSEKVREGIVIKAMDNYSVESNKMALKWVSEDYLSDATNTDEH